MQGKWHGSRKTRMLEKQRRRRDFEGTPAAYLTRFIRGVYISSYIYACGKNGFRKDSQKRSAQCQRGERIKANCATLISCGDPVAP